MSCLTDKSSIPLDERTYFRRAETPECDSRITPYNTPERGSSVDIRTISEIFKRMTPKHLHGKKKFNFFFKFDIPSKKLNSLYTSYRPPYFRAMTKSKRREKVLSECTLLNLEYNLKSRDPTTTWDMIESDLKKPWDIPLLSMHKNITCDIIATTRNRRWNWHFVSRNPNVTIPFIRVNIFRRWSWDHLSLNMGIKITDMLENRDLPWKWATVTFRKDFDPRYIMTYPHIDWPYTHIYIWCECDTETALYMINNNLVQRSTHPYKLWHDLTFDIVKSHPEIEWNYSLLSEAKFITIDIVMDNKDKPWNWDLLHKNPNITTNDLLSHNIPLNYKCLSSNPNLSLDFIKEHINEPWDMRILSGHPCITIEFVKEHIDIKWDWYNLSRKCSLKDIDENNTLPWNWTTIHFRYDLTMEFIKKYISNFRNRIHLSEKTNLTWDFIIDNPDIARRLNWYVISRHPCITWDIVANNPDYPWDWYAMSQNRNITIEHIRQAPDKEWSFNSIYFTQIQLIRGDYKWCPIRAQ